MRLVSEKKVCIILSRILQEVCCVMFTFNVDGMARKVSL